MVQMELNLFAPADPPGAPVPDRPKKPKQQKKVYRCSCGRTVTVYIPVVFILCECGRVMREEAGT